MRDSPSALTVVAAADAAEVAAVAGHALNNVLAHLFAASGYLEPPGADAARARAAVEDACRGGQALAAALTLLGMTAENLADVPPHAQYLDAAALARALDSVAEVSGAEARGVDPACGGWATTLDADSIAAILICAAITLRRAWGPALPLRCGVVTPTAADGRLLLRIEPAVDGPPIPPRRAGHGPCERALSHVAPLLPGLDAALEDRGPAGMDLALRPRDAVPEPAHEATR
jgi:stage V sporulation protein SpoVS